MNIFEQAIISMHENTGLTLEESRDILSPFRKDIGGGDYGQVEI